MSLDTTSTGMTFVLFARRINALRQLCPEPAKGIQGVQVPRGLGRTETKGPKEGLQGKRDGSIKNGCSPHR